MGVNYIIWIDAGEAYIQSMYIYKNSKMII